MPKQRFSEGNSKNLRNKYENWQIALCNIRTVPCSKGKNDQVTREFMEWSKIIRKTHQSIKGLINWIYSSITCSQQISEKKYQNPSLLRKAKLKLCSDPNSPSSRMTISKERSMQILGKRNHFSLLVGMQTDVALMEISMISKQLKIQL